MVVQQRPSQNRRLGGLNQGPESIDKILPIIFVPENISSLDPPNHDVMQGPRDI
jgi:hypothetical protein